MGEWRLDPDLEWQRTKRKCMLEKNKNKGWALGTSMLCLGASERQWLGRVCVGQ